MCLKCYFWKKAIKIAAASGAPSPKPPLPPTDGGSVLGPPLVTPANCYSTLLSVFLVLNAFYYDRYRTNVTSADVLHFAFAPIFHFRLCSSFVDREAKIFFAPRRRVL